MKHEAPTCRLEFLFARDAPRAVIFRRGPSKRTRQILWHLDTDTFEPGQWFTGSLYLNRCSLSPNGRYLVYGAATHRGPHRTWVAVSRPPYFTAISFWTGSVHLGAGWFGSDQHLFLSSQGEGGLRQDADPKRPWPSWLTVGEATEESWRQCQDMEKREPTHGAFLQTTRREVGRGAAQAWDEYTLHLPGREPVRLDAARATFDSAGRLVVGRQGQLWVAEIDSETTKPKLHLLADFDDQAFEKIAPPEWATRW